MNCRLTLVARSGSFIRNQRFVVGTYVNEPAVGKTFKMLLTNESGRIRSKELETGPVIELNRKTNGIYFQTFNSLYRFDQVVEE